MSNLAILESGLPATRTTIMDLEQSMRGMEESMTAEECQDELNTHLFAPGIYGRKMFIPAGTCIVGKIHMHSHLNIITHGVIRVVTEFDNILYEGSNTWISKAGIKRAVFAIEDTEWITIHPNPTNTEDLDILENSIIAPDFDTLDKLLLEKGVTV